MLRRRRREGGVPFLYPSFPVEFSYGKYLLEERERERYRDDSSLPRKRGGAGGETIFQFSYASVSVKKDIGGGYLSCWGDKDFSSFQLAFFLVSEFNAILWEFPNSADFSGGLTLTYSIHSSLRSI